MRFTECRQDGSQHLLGRRLSDTAGDRDQAAGEALTCVAAKAMQACKRVVDQEQPTDGRDVTMHHGTGRTLCERVGDEAMTIAGLALQRDKQVAGVDGAGVDRHASGGEVRRLHRATGRFEQLARGP